MTVHDEVRIRLLEHSFHYSIARRGLEIESADVPLTAEPVPVFEDEYYGGSEAMD